MEGFTMSQSKFNDDIFKKNLHEFLTHISNRQTKNQTALTTGKGYFFWYSEVYLANIVELVIADSVLGKRFAWKELGQSILALTGKGKAKNKTDDQISETILNQVIKKAPDNFFCVIPFHGINLNEPYNLGNVTLYPSNQKEAVIQDAISDNFRNQLLDTITDSQNFATVNVQAVIPAGAIEVALSEVKAALNILRFLINVPTKMYQIGVGKPNKNMSDKEFIAVSEKEGVTQHPFQYIPVSAELNAIQPIGKKYITKMGEIQTKIYNSETTIPLEKGLFNATNLIAESLDTEELTMQLIQLMSAIEALVEQKTFVQGITDQVCERTALLLGENLHSRQEIYNKLTNLYKKRSNLSHGNTAIVTHYDVVYLWNVARSLCFYFQLNFDRFSDSNNQEKKNLKEYLLDLRFENKKM